MGKGKLLKVAELDTFPNVYQNRNRNKVVLENANSEPVSFRDKWSSECFGNQNPLVLELACGKGDYAIELGRLFPDYNFIGVDLKGARIWQGAKTALKESLDNVRFIRSQIDFLDQIFGKNEVSEIWITFPDPYPSRSKSRKRLSSMKFLSLYKKVLQPEGIIHFKTDSDSLYQFTLKTCEEMGAEMLDKIDDVYGQNEILPVLAIQTYYEKMHLKKGRTIHYVSFKLP